MSEKVAVDGTPLPPNGMYSKVSEVETEEIQANLRRIKDSGESDLALLPLNKNGIRGVSVRSVDSDLLLGFLPEAADDIPRFAEGVSQMQIRDFGIRAKVVMFTDSSSRLGMSIYLYDDDEMFIWVAIAGVLKVLDRINRL